MFSSVHKWVSKVDEELKIDDETRCRVILSSISNERAWQCSLDSVLLCLSVGEVVGFEIGLFISTAFWWLFSDCFWHFFNGCKRLASSKATDNTVCFYVFCIGRGLGRRNPTLLTLSWCRYRIESWSKSSDWRTAQTTINVWLNKT